MHCQPSAELSCERRDREIEQGGVERREKVKQTDRTKRERDRKGRVREWEEVRACREKGARYREQVVGSWG
jgi:hypothetical protein